MHMLDTNTCIYVLKERSQRLRHRFKVTPALCISAVTYAELCFGIENSAASLRDARWGQLAAFTRLLLIEPLGGRSGPSLRAFARLAAAAGSADRQQ